MDNNVRLIQSWLMYLENEKGFGKLYQSGKQMPPEVRIIDSKCKKYVVDMNLDVDLSTIDRRYLNTKNYWNGFVNHLMQLQLDTANRYRNLAYQYQKKTLQSKSNVKQYRSYEVELSATTDYREQQRLIRKMARLEDAERENQDYMKSIDAEGRRLVSRNQGLQETIELAKCKKWISAQWNKQPNSRMLILQVVE